MPFRPMSANSMKSNLPVERKTARNASSNATLPAIVYTKNCVAADVARGPPQSLMRKKAGIRLNSQ